MDADTVIMNSNIRLQDVLPATTNGDLLVSADTGGGYNAGAWMIRNSAWGHQFLETWWSMKSFVRPPGLSHSGDNAALKALLGGMQRKSVGTKSEFEQHILAPPRCTFNSFAKFLDPAQYKEAIGSLEQQEWYKSEAFYHKGDFVAHVAGVDNKVTTLELLLAYAS